jgi:hypothetical protein
MTEPPYRLHALKAKAEIVCPCIQTAYRMVRRKSGNAYQAGNAVVHMQRVTGFEVLGHDHVD